jgi:hypothetical protein
LLRILSAPQDARETGTGQLLGCREAMGLFSAWTDPAIFLTMLPLVNTILENVMAQLKNIK